MNLVQTWGMSKWGFIVLSVSLLLCIFEHFFGKFLKVFLYSAPLDPEVGKWSWIIWVVSMWSQQQGRGGRQWEDVMLEAQWARFNHPVLALKREEGGTSQGLWEASGSWKRPGTGFCTSTSREMQPSWHLDFSAVKHTSDFWPIEL